MPLSVNDQLTWDAFQYISGEMSTDNSVQFESQLEDNQTARETVAQMVEISQIVSHTSTSAEQRVTTWSSTRNDSTDTWIKPLRWMSYGAAACMLFMLGIQAASRTGVINDISPTHAPNIAQVHPDKNALNSEANSVAQHTPDSQTLALAFLSQSDGIEQANEGRLETSHEITSIEETSLEETSLEEVEYQNNLNDEDSHLQVPSWLMAAVSPANSPSED